MHADTGLLVQSKIFCVNNGNIYIFRTTMPAEQFFLTEVDFGTKT